MIIINAIINIKSNLYFCRSLAMIANIPYKNDHVIQKLFRKCWSVALFLICAHTKITINRRYINIIVFTLITTLLVIRKFSYLLFVIIIFYTYNICLPIRILFIFFFEYLYLKNYLSLTFYCK